MTARSEPVLPLTMFTAWLARGERGLSSEAIVSAVTGEQVTRYPSPRTDYPHDPADLRRCVQLIEQHPLLAFVFKDAIQGRGMSASKLAPLPDDWRASLDAYEAWHTTVPGLTGHYAKQAWQAAWEACTQHHQINRHERTKG